MPSPVRVLIADDHPMFRFGLTAAIGAAPEIDLLGEASSGAELVEMVDRITPDVVITDLAMPGTDGVSATREIKARHPAVAVLVLTMHEDDEAVFGAIRAGARGYLLKGAESGDIVRAVLSVARGDAVYGTNVAQRIVDCLTGANAEHAGTVFPELTDREREILELVAGGQTNHEIARRFVLSEKTIRNNVASILAKLQVGSRAAAVAKARDAGLGKAR
ncbi:response regulator transcription factor [Actinoplanes sp. TBRC 11911]|uniref:response regulator transcription factor n=1 Tax=Actinoplanes sp. TBRC 11911 TaxID=2729386 RepID=UPI00145DB5ED|nr:response regulator transcription factor [Actinoplanes sp. TBRC 11911]NMO53965.1 response regulator transcription factor [Actinoplanes sp. TBRC 11911]